VSSFDYLKMTGAFMYESDREMIKAYTDLAASRFDPCVVVQIGIEHGASVYCSRAGASGAVIYGIDLIGDNQLEGTEEQKKELNLKVIRGNSHEVWKDFQEPIHFLFIDGDHHYEHVSQDVQDWTPKVVIGGIVGFHDAKVVDWTPFVTKAIDEWLNDSWEELPGSKLCRFFRRVK